MKKRVWKNGLAAAALGMGLLAAMPSMAFGAQVLPEGLYVGEQSLGGMTEEEAEKAVQAYIDNLTALPVSVDIDGTTVETTTGELGLTWSNPDAVKETADQYEYGSLVKQYMARKDLEQAPVKLSLEVQTDPAKVKAFVDEKCQGFTAQAQDASITRENGQFVITDSVVGVAVDTAATEAALNEAITAALADGGSTQIQVAAAVTEQQPRIKTEDLATIQDVLGTFTTDFSSSGASRSTNLTVGAAKINGHVLMPGETLSGYECLQPFTTANGYRTAAAYENGQVVDSVGGGVCQIATTLYNMALNAELEITQRQNHSMIVTYVKPSKDAAIAGTYKDIKFTNNYSTPIYVEGYTEGKKLTFTVYGKETRPANRRVEYVSETLGTTSPGEPQQIVDNSLAPGARVKVQSSHTGLRSRLWKVVYVDDVETERTLLHTDTYNASKAIYRVGPAVPAEAPVETPAAPTETPVVEPVTGVDGGPGVSPAPSPEPAPGPGPDPAPAADPAGQPGGPQ